MPSTRLTMNDLSHLGTAGLHKFPFIAQSKVFSWSIRGNQRGLTR